MIRTRICDLLGIPHPIVLGGMGNATTAPLVAAVSNAGGFGTLGTSAFDASTLDREIASIHERTEKPFGINHLLFQIQENMFAVTLAAQADAYRLRLGAQRPESARLLSARPRRGLQGHVHGRRSCRSFARR